MSFDKDTNLTATYGEIPLHATFLHHATTPYPIHRTHSHASHASIYVICIDIGKDVICFNANLGNNKLINTIMDMRG